MGINYFCNGLLLIPNLLRVVFIRYMAFIRAENSTQNTYVGMLSGCEAFLNCKVGMHTLGDMLREREAETSSFVCRHRAHVAGTVCKSSAHDATLKIEVTLSLTSCTMLRGNPRNRTSTQKRTCHKRKTVAATCSPFMSPQHVR